MGYRPGVIGRIRSVENLLEIFTKSHIIDIVVVRCLHTAVVTNCSEVSSLEEKICIHEKSRGETINVYIGEYAGKKYLHIREWYLDVKDSEEKPTKKGVAIPLEKVDQLKEAITKLLG